MANPQPETGCIPSQEFTEWDVTVYCYSTLVYQFAVKVLAARDVDGAGFLTVTREQLNTLAIRFPGEVFRLDENLRTVWLGPIWPVCIRFMNDPRTPSDEDLPADERSKKARSEQVKVVGV